MKSDIAGMDLSCMIESVEKYQLPAKDCVLPLLSKVLGYAIVAASVFLKLPQIYVIVKNKSIKGLSVASFELEVAGFTIALAYCLFKQLPFSAYGELVFILAQSIACLGLIYYYSPKVGPGTWLKTALYCALAPTLLGGKLDARLFEALYACQHAIFFCARLPQIYENFKNKSTGQLSFMTSFMSFAGCMVRTFTSVQENAPLSMLVGCLLGVLTHGTICAQIVAYASSSSSSSSEAVKTEKKAKKME
jgi:mannose-P-dolichol utilization defect protein 1